MSYQNLCLCLSTWRLGSVRSPKGSTGTLTGLLLGLGSEEAKEYPDVSTFGFVKVGFDRADKISDLASLVVLLAGSEESRDFGPYNSSNKEDFLDLLDFWSIRPIISSSSSSNKDLWDCISATIEYLNIKKCDKLVVEYPLLYFK